MKLDKAVQYHLNLFNQMKKAHDQGRRIVVFSRSRAVGKTEAMRIWNEQQRRTNPQNN